ncbi:MAG: hypothetical protein LBE89_06490 [Helicobacteraceae bacterium]|jgi:hypothetical protein|nr:hypothetical protein [Helicobacteraceae bacterium]
MDNLERLKAIGIEEINSKTHISVTELMALFNRNYKAFNRAKLNGFIKIIEREFNIDLSDLLNDYGRYEQDNGGDEQSLAVAIPKKSDEPKGRWKIAIAILVAAAAVLYVNLNVRETPPTPVPVVVVPQLPPVEEPPVEEPQEEELATLPEEPQEEECFVESDSDLWIGVFYTDDETRMQTTISGRYDFVSDRAQIITFGHGMFRLSCFDTVIEPASEAIQRVRIKDGTIVSSSQPQLRRESAPVERETE